MSLWLLPYYDLRMAWLKPETAEIRAVLRRYAPQLAEEPIEFLSEGWEFWAFTAGDHVLRFPRPVVDLHRLPEGSTNLGSLRLEMAVLPSLAEALTVPVPRIDVFGEDGPNDAPFLGHRMLPGEPVLFAKRAPGPHFGRDYGLLLRELRAVPGRGGHRRWACRTSTARRCESSAGATTSR